MILPACLVEKFTRPFWIVRKRLDIGIEVSHARIELRYPNFAQTQANRIDQLLAVHQHRHGLTDAFVLEIWALVVPEDLEFAGKLVFGLGKLLLKSWTAC